MSYLIEFLEYYSSSVEVLTEAQSRDFDERWLKIFASEVKKEHDTWIYRGFRWHGFSYELQPCLNGESALIEYQTQSPDTCIVYDEEFTQVLSCRFNRYPDFTQFRDDVYVTQENFNWTMVFTHEQPELGPFFAIPIT